jgi:colicin import membrane protein
VNVKVDKTLVASIALHVLVIGWGLVSFSTRALEAPPESLDVDVISADQLAKITKGIRSGEKDKPKPLVEKVAEAKPVDDAVGKITEKKEIITSSAPAPQPKSEEKPVEKKPDPPKPVAEKKDELKPAEKKPDEAKEDPIAEAIKKQEAKKPTPKQEAKAAPAQPPKPKQERVFDQSKIAQLLDKRDPTRQAMAGTELNPTASLGTHTGNADAIVATWKGAFIAAVRRCFNFPYTGEDADQFMADIDIQMRLDGTLVADPSIVAVYGPSKSIATAVAESAKRAIIQCQAYTFLPKQHYETWKYIPLRFGLNDML